MKNKVITALTFMAITAAFNQVDAQQFIDLGTGKAVVLVKNNADGMMYNTDTRRPAYIYINPATSDTLYGRTGEIINGKVTRTADGHYTYDDGTYVYRNGDYTVKTPADYDPQYKKKVENDGDVKIKGSEGKRKIEADGVLKVKEGDYRKKIDSQGNEKIKDSTFKGKNNADGTIKVKDYDSQYKGKIDENGNFKEKGAHSKRKMKNQGKTKMKNDSLKVKEEADGDLKVKPQ